jgi:hypothetical protein
MSSTRTKKLQQECVRLSSLQMKSTGERYLELDRQWSRVAVLLNKSRLRDFINATNKACSRQEPAGASKSQVACGSCG